MEENGYIQRKLDRERLARKEAERIMEEKSLELYQSNKQLKNLNASLEAQVEERTAEALKNQEQLHVLFENHPFAIMVFSAESLSFLFVNKTAIDKYGYSREEFLKKRVLDLHLEEEWDQFLAVQDNKEAFCGSEWTHQTKDGEHMIIKVNGSYIEFHDEWAKLLIIEDITEVKRIQREKELNELRYQELVERVSDIIYKCSSDGSFAYVNPKAVHFTGHSEEELLNMHFSDLIREDYKSYVISFYAEQSRSKKPTTYLEFPIVTKDGEEYWIGQKVDVNFIGDGDIELIALARNITERKQAQDELRRSEEKYRDMIENMELGLLEVDNNDIITNVYPKFLELTGYKTEELLGENVIEKLLPEEFKERMYHQNELRMNGKSGVYEVQLIRKDGSLVWVIISGAPLYDSSGTRIGSIGIHLDISSQKEMEDELRAAKEVAESSVRTQELFMANMSHEIRTPMNAIIGMSELILKTDLTNKQEGYIEAIQTSADNLLVIINDILDFSKVESGKMELESTAVSLPKLITNVRKTVGLKAEQKGLRMVCTVDNRVQTYRTDPTRLNQVLINLAGNAVKFTQMGRVEIVCRVLNSKETSDQLLFQIKDTGIGIAEDKIDKIFEDFIQAEESTAKLYGGTGLGLAISKRLVSMMGGELSVNSELGVGSEFFFMLELEREEPLEEPVSTEVQVRTLLKDTRVLLVEDHEINRFMAQTILEGWNCEVSLAVDGLDAVKKVSDGDYDIVLMDVRMPNMDGIEATRVIRREINQTIPIIALTANAIKGDSVRCMEAGMNDYVSKPFKQDDLWNKLVNNLNISSDVELEEEPMDSFEEEQKKEGLVDLTGLRQDTGGDKEFIKKMIQMFIDHVPGEVASMKEMITSEDYGGLSGLAHRMKPSIDSLAVSTMQSLVREIEEGGRASDQMQKLTEDFIQRLEKLVVELEEHV